MTDTLSPADFIGAPNQARSLALSPDEFIGKPQPDYAGALPPGWTNPTPSGDDVPSLIPSFGYGLRKPIDAGAQLLTRGLAALTPSGSAAEKYMQGETQRVEGINKTAADTYKQDPFAGTTAGNIAETAGSVAPALAIGYAMPGAGAASLPARMLSGGAAGGASAALTPVDNAQSPSDFWKQKAEQVGVGAATGAAVPAITSGLARVISPQTSDKVKTLMESGVTPTPGQALGGAANTLEEASQSVPIGGEFVKQARYRAVRQMNTAAINNALDYIGEKLPSGSAGNEAIEQASQKISAAFDRTIPNLTSKVDVPFAQNMAELADLSKNMAPDRAAQFAAIMNNQIVRKISPNGTITGESAHEIQSTLGRLAALAHRSPDMDQRLLGDALQQAQQNVLDLISRSNPEGASAFNAARAAYKNFLPVQRAASYLGADEGVFSPAQLLGAVKAGDRSLNNSAFAKGNATGQGFAQAAKSVLGNKVPDSGTALRSLSALNLAEPKSWVALGMAPLSAVQGLAYSPWGQAALSHAMTARPEFAGPLAGGLRFISPGLSGAAGLLAGQ